MASVKFSNVGKWFDESVAVDDFSLDVKDGEFIVLVGPSGCGKTTLLRLLAGLEEIDKGDIFIDDHLVNDVDSKDRNIAMVFQNYALYPHMDVFDNIAFGLKLRKYPKDKIKSSVQDAAKILRIENLLERKPKELSGGEKQRVALGRAIVRHPKVFLFDEPLSNLDAKLRVQMRAEIKKLHSQLKTTIIYVTHDQVEAMTMGDRIVIMNEGKSQQVGSSLDVYQNPRNLFVSGFIGSPPMNFITGYLKNGKLTNEKFSIDLNKYTEVKKLEGMRAILGVRPEDIYLSKDGLELPLLVTEPLGNETLLHMDVGQDIFVAKVKIEDTMDMRQPPKIKFDIDKIYLFDIDTEQRIELKKYS
ncbi:MAG TPA: sn-glycerol-3-phosphate ABC transporter ATP-binding protein UgpC [Candidatus Marinimicrobia bacterium]|nr:sn-glycerol-3-phosphate ABC transporter ATP-binding protein UgpC [Candidatus Neomarinimicrobiota bacterium]